MAAACCALSKAPGSLPGMPLCPISVRHSYIGNEVTLFLQSIYSQGQRGRLSVLHLLCFQFSAPKHFSLGFLGKRVVWSSTVILQFASLFLYVLTQLDGQLQWCFAGLPPPKPVIPTRGSHLRLFLVIDRVLKSGFVVSGVISCTVSEHIVRWVTLHRM